jgi:signal transduction histidine kinase
MNPAPQSARAPSSASGEDVARILVIDDDENIRGTLEEFIGLNGYVVETARDGATGIDLLGRNHYDLVLCDLRMPGVDGMAVIEWVREARPNLAVVVMTGNATVESSIRALRLRADDFLLKPFTLEAIERSIGNCLARRRLERRNVELSQSNDRLREIERIKDDLLAAVSHEFRTPLTAIQGFLVLFEHQGVSNLRPEQLQALEAIRDNSQRLDTMIGNLLTLTESHDGQYHPLLEPTRLGAFLDEYLRGNERLPSGLQVEISPEARSADVLLDRQRFPLVVTNLLDNARKFARESGPTHVILRARATDTECTIELHDDGIGVSESMGDRVFERFAQGDMTSTRAHSGAGLGLAVVREIVEAHGGSVRLIPPVLSGTSVRIDLPRAGAH